MTLSSAGLLSGTPTATGTFNFTAGVQDANSCTATQAYSLAIAAPTITLSPASLPAPTVGAAYSQTVTASGGGTPYTYGVTSGALPAGLTLSPGGAISGTPTAGGTFSFTVTATDAGNFTGSMAYAFTVNAPTISLTPASLPNPSVGTAYSQTVTANGGTAPYTFSTTPGTLPAGLSLSSAGVLSGTPTAAGTVSFTITATDSSTGAGPYVGTRSYTVTLNAPTITVTPASLPNPTFGTAYSQTVSAGGGTSPYTFATTAGTLPTGLTLSSGGAISGTPTAGGTFSFTVTATDAGGFTGSMAYTLTVSGGPAILTVMGDTEPATLATDDCSPASGDASCATLRGAVNHAASNDIIVFNKATMDGVTINLTMASNDLSTGGGEFGPSAFFISGKTLTIDATANGLTKGVVIARSSTGGTANFRLFDVGVGSSLTLRGLTLSNGYAAAGNAAYGGGALGAGGAIFNQGTLSLLRCTLDANTARGGSSGGPSGLYGGAGVGQDSQFDVGGGPNGGARGAQASDANFGSNGNGGPGGTGGSGGLGGGGGVGAYGGYADGTGSGGNGGSGGVGGFGGGGAVGGSAGLGGSGSVSSRGSSGSGGSGGFGAGGGAAAGPTTPVVGATGGFGGGSAFASSGGGGAGMGGAIFNDAGNVALTNVTLTNDLAQGGNGSSSSDNGSGYGGAIFNYAGSLTQDFVTLSGNNVAAGTGGRGGSANGGAIYSLADSAAACSAGGNTCSTSGNATLTMNHSIAANSRGGAQDVVVNAINSGSSSGSGAYNAIGAATGFTASNAVSGTLSLGALPATLTGGLVDVMIPQTGSVAIDAAGSAPCSQATDQRGMSRPQGAACDVGAVEVYVPAPVSLSAAFSPTSVTFGGTSIFTVTATNPNTIALTNVQFGSTVPAGLKLVTQIGGTCATLAVQGGMFTINPGTGVWSGTSNVLAPGQSCTISVSVRPTSVGSFVDATSTVTSNEAPTGPAASATLVVTPAPLTITANDASKTYDAAAYSGGNGVAYAGFVNGDNAAVLGGTLTYGGNSQGAVNVGSYAITPGGLTSSNYAISFVSGTLTINPAATATALAASWSSAPTTPVYGQSVTFTATVSTTPASGAMPIGTVAFSDGGTALPGCSSVAVDGSGNAACQTSSLAVSTHTIAATYTPAGSNFGPSGPASISQAVNKAATTTTRDFARADHARPSGQCECERGGCVARHRHADWHGVDLGRRRRGRRYLHDHLARAELFTDPEHGRQQDADRNLHTRCRVGRELQRQQQYRSADREPGECRRHADEFGQSWRVRPSGHADRHDHSAHGWRHADRQYRIHLRWRDDLHKPAQSDRCRQCRERELRGGASEPHRRQSSGDIELRGRRQQRIGHSDAGQWTNRQCSRDDDDDHATECDHAGRHGQCLRQRRRVRTGCGDAGRIGDGQRWQRELRRDAERRQRHVHADATGAGRQSFVVSRLYGHDQLRHQHRHGHAHGQCRARGHRVDQFGESVDQRADGDVHRDGDADGGQSRADRQRDVLGRRHSAVRGYSVVGRPGDLHECSARAGHAHDPGELRRRRQRGRIERDIDADGEQTARDRERDEFGQSLAAG